MAETVVEGVVGGLTYRVVLDPDAEPAVQWPAGLAAVAPARGDTVSAIQLPARDFDPDDPEAVWTWLTGHTTVFSVVGPPPIVIERAVPGRIY